MTDADYFYDKLLASIGLPSDEPQTPKDYGRKDSSWDKERNGRGERGEPHTTKPPPLEPQHHPKPEPPPQPKPKQEPKKQDQGSKPPQLELRRNAGSPTFTLPQKPTTSAAELREKLARQLERPLPSRSPLPQPPAPVAALKPPSEAPSPASHASESPRSKEEEPRKNPAALEAELRRKLLENGLRKRKPSPLPEGRVMKVEGNEKRQKTTPPPPLPPLPPPPTTTSPSPKTPPSSAPPPPPLSPPHPVAASTATERGPIDGEQISNAELLKSRQAELRRKLLERSNILIKQKPPAVQTNGDPPNHKYEPTRKVNRSYSPIEISSDEEGEAPPLSSKPKTLSSFPSFLPPRPPPREGFKLRISVPFPGAPGGSIVLKTEKLPLSTPISSILELFGAARDGDHLYFPGLNPKPAAETENGEKGDLVLGEEGQRFYRDGDDTGGRDSGVIKEEGVTPPRPAIKKEDGWGPRSAGSSLKGVTSSLRGDAMDYVPGSHFKEVEAAEPQWTGISATLEDVWTRGRKVVGCTLIRAEEPEDDQDEDHGLPEHHLEDRGNSWNPRHQHRHSRSDFSTGIDHQWGDDQNGEEGELEGDDEGDGEGWGYSEGYPESGEGGPNSMNWGPGYPMGQGHTQGSWNTEQFPMIPNTNIPDPNAQWYSGQHPQYQHSAQPSPVFSQHDEGQGPTFMGGGASVPQAMHWVPGHMDYANAGWMYGFGPNDIQQNAGLGPSTDPTERPPSAVDEVNKVVADGKLPGPVQSQQQPQHPRVQVGSSKPKRPRGGRQVKKKERRKGGSGGGGVGRSGGSVGVVN